MESYMLCLSFRDENIIFLFCVRLNVHENLWDFDIVYLEDLIIWWLPDVELLNFYVNSLESIIIYFLEVALPNQHLYQLPFLCRRRRLLRFFFDLLHHVHHRSCSQGRLPQLLRSLLEFLVLAQHFAVEATPGNLHPLPVGVQAPEHDVHPQVDHEPDVVGHDAGEARPADPVVPVDITLGDRVRVDVKRIHDDVVSQGQAEEPQQEYLEDQLVNVPPSSAVRPCHSQSNQL